MTKSNKARPLFDFASHILSILSRSGPETNLNKKTGAISPLHPDGILAGRFPVTMDLTGPVPSGPPLRVNVRLARLEVLTMWGVFPHKGITRIYSIPMPKIEHPLHCRQGRLLLYESRYSRPLLKKLWMGETPSSKEPTLAEGQSQED